MRLSLLLRLCLHLTTLAVEASRADAQRTPTTTAPAKAAATRRIELSVGKPATLVRIELREQADGYALAVGKTQLALPPLPAPPALSGESVSLRGGTKVGVVRIAAGPQELAALLGRASSGATVVWTGRLDLHGDPGERRADAIEVRAGENAEHELVVGAYDERVRICGQARTLLAARALDPTTLELQPTAVDPIAGVRAQGKSTQVTATTRSPGPQGAPVLHGLWGSSVSSGDGGGTVVDARLVTDGKAETVWRSQRRLGGRYEFVSLRWEPTSRPIRALALRFPEPQGATPSLASPRAISLVTERGRHVQVALPTDAPAGERLWVVPETPLGATCVSLVFDDVSAPEPTSEVGLAEVEAFTDLDFAGGVDALVSEVVRGGHGAADAAQLLAQVRGEAGLKLAAAWPRLDAQGRRRVLRSVAVRSGDDDDALGLLELGLRDDDAEVRALSLELALSAAPKTNGLLARFVQDGGEHGDEAARGFARAAPAHALPALLEALHKPGGSERPVLREALGVSLTQGGEKAEAALQAWFEQHPSLPPPTQAALALALATVAPGQELAGKLVAEGLGTAADFPEQWRLTRAAAHLKADAEVDGFLVGLASDAGPWMLRAEALRALAARRSEHADAAARRALVDEYPRVRATALEVLGSAPDAVEVLSQSARTDSWFLVREAALEELPKKPESVPTLTGGLADRSFVVRAAAVRGLRRLRHSAAFAQVEARLRDPGEHPDVVAEAIAYGRALCIAEAVPALQELVQRGLRPDAGPAAQELGLSALEALGGMGPKPATWAHEQTRVNPLVPEAIRRSAQRAAEQSGPCSSLD